MNMFGMTWEEIFALLLPGGAAQRAGGWYVHGLSLRGVLVSSRDRFFKEMRLRWEWLRGISLDEFCWPGFFPVGSRVRADCAEPLSERLIGCGRCSLRDYAWGAASSESHRGSQIPPGGQPARALPRTLAGARMYRPPGRSGAEATRTPPHYPQQSCGSYAAGRAAGHRGAHSVRADRPAQHACSVRAAGSVRGPQRPAVAARASGPHHTRDAPARPEELWPGA